MAKNCIIARPRAWQNKNGSGNRRPFANKTDLSVCYMTACFPLVTVRDRNKNGGIIQRNTYKKSSRIQKFEERRRGIEGVCINFSRPWWILRNFEERHRQIEGTCIGKFPGRCHTEIGNNTKTLVLMDCTFHGNSRRGHWKHGKTLEIVAILARHPVCVSHDCIGKVTIPWGSFKTLENKQSQQSGKACKVTIHRVCCCCAGDLPRLSRGNIPILLLV